MDNLKENKKRYFTVNEFRNELGNVISRQQIYRMIDKGEIPSRLIGNKKVIDGDWVRAYVAMPCLCTKKVQSNNAVNENAVANRVV